MPGLKRICAAVCCTVQLLCLSGCTGTTIFSDFHEIEKIEIIRTLGIDVGEEGVCLTADSGVGLNGTPPRLYHQQAPTLAAAVSILENTYPDRQPFFTHAENLLIGEEAARTDISGWLDYVARSPKMRLMIGLVVVRGDAAGAVMEAVMSEKTSASDMLTDITADVEMLGAGSETTCGQALAQMLEGRCTMAQAVKAAEATGTGGAGQMLVPCGFALLKDGRLCGYLEPEQAAAANILTGRFEALNLAVGEAGGDTVTLHMTQADAVFEPEYEDGHLVRVDIRISAGADVSEIYGGSVLEDDRIRAALEQAAARQLELRAAQAIAVTQELDGDFMGIGSRVELAAPAEFRKMEPSWEERYQDLELRVCAQVTLRRSYDMDQPASAGGKNNGK